ncbi:hypothetical protein Nmel_011207 [Mimus melanotis]
MWGAKLKETPTQASPFSSPCLEGFPQPGTWRLGGLVHKGSVLRTPGLFWHQLNLLPPDSGTPLALGAVVADSGCALAGEPCQLGTLVVVLGNELLVVSVVIIRTNLLTQSQ